ncbi:sulfate adenylyltransferase subunit CysD [Akkermansiaceae bacterium]|nr:sulfate adenylyltransferase subunit CysD [Akkermansiaceae bacterium]MDB4282178.1 sulfate adenylyltransferase subunit CysD [Akkermansiaceae bacterium]MDB4804678.1 sulfate adenylyltransferase subunit CysD [Akkermansiaceae bacterium]MDC0286854.1 sulfate adenylyltransferase subunit CysD [Akkermansiaceae bacterium]
MSNYNLSHLDQLEAEAIFILRETAAQFENPGLLFSAGKDSIVMAHIARKAFYPSRIPFPLVHVDTGHNFPETIAFRDAYAEKIGARLLVGLVQDSIERGTAIEETGLNASRNKLQTVTLLETIEEQQYDAVLGGGRRDEEKARAKERFFSHRNDFGEWDPKNQRPELWNLFNGRKQPGENFRVFPLSNFTEMDVWMYMKQEGIELPSLYYAHQRDTVTRNGVILAVSEFVQPRDGETIESKMIRFRTMGDATITGAIESSADTMEKIIEEVAAARQTERGNRADDKCSETAMEDRKKEGYF